jgi:hypothetical protein
MNYAPMNRLGARLNLPVPSHAAFCKHQELLMEPIMRLARASCDRVCAQLPAGSAASFDGCRARRANADWAGAVLSCQTQDQTSEFHGKVIEFGTVSRSFCGQQGDFVGSSRAMEGHGRPVQKWKSSSTRTT